VTPRPERFSLGDFLPIIEKKISSQLISKAAFNKIKKHADMLPGQISSFFGFECVLDTPATTADFLFCSTQLQSHSKILTGLHKSIPMPASLYQMPAWKIVQQFCIDWEDDSSPMFQQLYNIWLEFDIAQSTPPYVPSIFFGTLPPEKQDESARRATILDALKRLMPEATEGQRALTINTVFRHLPPNAYIFQVGVMLSRQSPAIRLCLRNISNDLIVETLIKIGWTGNVEELSHLIQEISPLCDRIDIDIDIGEQIGEKIGIECSFGRNPNTLNLMKNYTRWLVGKQLTTQEKASALVDFNGLIHQDAEPDIWPEFLLKMAALSGHDNANHIAYWLHHIKLVYRSDQALSAKAYLAMSHDRLSRQTLREHIELLKK
jgi:hypothetical protein